MIEVACEVCGRYCPMDSEQAACIRLYGECIVCRAEKVHKIGEDLNIVQIVAEQKKYQNKPLHQSANSV